jgi:signal peptidase I
MTLRILGLGFSFVGPDAIMSPMDTTPKTPAPKSDIPPKPAQAKRKTARWRWTKILFSWALALVLALTLQRFAFQSYQVFGQSMEPTLHEGDYLIISKLSKTWAGVTRDDYVPERGDIVVLNSSASGNRLIKRVIGLPGERVIVSGGSVKVINSEHPDGFNPYQELGLDESFAAGQLSTQVPDGHVFLIGDNRQPGGSLDSRNELGPVPTEDILGKLVLRLYPFSKVHAY